MVFKDILRQRAKKSSSVSLLNQLHPEQVILAPVVTEKTYSHMESDIKVYYFKVHKKATKNDVKASIHSLYKVDIDSVRIVNVPFKGRSNRKLVRRAYKKAVVTVKKGQSIELV